MAFRALKFEAPKILPGPSQRSMPSGAFDALDSLKLLPGGEYAKKLGKTVGHLRALKSLEAFALKSGKPCVLDAHDEMTIL